MRGIETAACVCAGVPSYFGPPPPPLSLSLPLSVFWPLTCRKVAVRQPVGAKDPVRVALFCNVVVVVVVVLLRVFGWFGADIVCMCCFEEARGRSTTPPQTQRASHLAASPLPLSASRPSLCPMRTENVCSGAMASRRHTTASSGAAPPVTTNAPPGDTATAWWPLAVLAPPSRPPPPPPNAGAAPSRARGSGGSARRRCAPVAASSSSSALHLVPTSTRASSSHAAQNALSAPFAAAANARGRSSHGCALA